jgi:ubiquitin carboxyl-terminal hydrolase 16/45
VERDSSSDDEMSIHSPETITTPVAPYRKARRRAHTIERIESRESRGRPRSKSIKSMVVDSDASDSEPDDDNHETGSKDSSKTSIQLSDVTPAPPPKVKISEASSPMAEISTSPLAVSIPRPSISSAPPRYILRKAYKRIKLQYPLPPVMILHLKRFYGTTSGSMKKIDDFVSFETEFDFTPYVFPIPKKEEKLQYRLTGVVVHLGSINSGQYVILCKTNNSYVSYFYTHKTLPPAVNDVEKAKKKDLNYVPDSVFFAREVPGQDRREWVYASDTTVRAASVDEVLRARAYLLVYEKVKNCVS